MSYVAQKKIKLSGHSYMPGELIEDAHILPGRVRALVRNGCIAEVKATAADNRQTAKKTVKKQTGTSAEPVKTTAEG